ncbi:hypothetical protein BCS42_05575 [Crenothrix sp. D3]|nr:hypothetical protein BCS42_05575 [Crenothrix sp. D3]
MPLHQTVAVETYILRVKIMKTHTFLKTALVAGLLAISGTSFAASSTVTTTFTGTIANSCSMATGAVGVLALSANGMSMKTSNLGGTAGSFTLTCTGTANMTIAVPNVTGGVNAAPYVKTSFLYSPAGTEIASGTGNATAVSQPSGIYTVGMGVGAGVVLATGDYASSVVTTITPN